MVRTQIYLSPEHHAELKHEAEQAGLSMTEMIRRLVASYLEGRRGIETVRKEDALAFVALGRSGRADTSENVAEALDEAFSGSIAG